MEPYWDAIKRIIIESDVVLHILDARLVKLSKNEEVERLVKEIGRPMIYVVNKSDLISKQGLKKQMLDMDFKEETVFVSGKNTKSVRILLASIKKNFEKYGKRQTIFTQEKLKYREAQADIVVGVLGYPNVGKSSIINALSHKGKVKVSKKAGTTHGVQWVRASKQIKLIDSPGVIPLKKDDEARYGLIGARDVDKIKDKDIVAMKLIELFIKNNKSAFEKFYDIEIKNNDFYEIIEEIGLKKGHLKKKGVIDENRTYSMIIRDWQTGKLRI